MDIKNNSLPRFAIALAAHNGSAHLEEQINSIIYQNGVLFTVFISVDASGDGTEDLVDSLAELDSRIVVLPHGQSFGSAAANFFRLLREIDVSDFDYVSLADQDDIWLPDKLLRAHTELSRTNAHGYSSNVTAFWPDGRQTLIKRSQPQARWDFLFESAGAGCTYVVKTELAYAIKNILNNHSGAMLDIGGGQHDWFMYAFARANHYVWFIDNFSGMLYRQHQNNLVGANLGLKAFFYRIRVVLNGWYFQQSLIIANLVGLSDSVFLIRWKNGGRLGLFWLGLHAHQCRRRLRDKLLFALSCLLLCFVKRS